MAYDVHWNNVVLAMHMDDTSLTDETGKTVTLNGNAARSSTQAKFGGYSCYLDGSGDYLSVPASTDLNLTSGDWTIECWFYCTTLTSGIQFIVNKDGVSGLSYPQYSLEISSSGKLQCFVGNGNGASPTGTTYTGATTVTLNQWNHAAVVKRGGYVYLYLNGNQDATGTAAAMYEGNKALLVGYQSGMPANSYFNGYIDDLRITKGVARYVENFTPPAAAFPDRLPLVSGVVRDASNNFAQRLVRVHDRMSGTLLGHAESNGTTGEYSVSVASDKEVYVIAHDATVYDPYWDKVVLAMHMNDVTLSDVKGKAVVRYGNVARSSAQAKFGGYSAAFDGSGDYIGLGSTVPTDLQIGGGDFTIDFWVYTTSTGAQFIIGNLDDTTGYGHFWVVLNSTYTGLHTVQFGVQGSVYKFGSSTLATSQWVHVELSRSGTNLRCFIDGTQLGTTKTVSNFTGTTSTGIRIGAALNNSYYYLNGYLDDLRVTKGVARHTADFTAPTAAFPDGVVGGAENAVILDRLVPG